MSNQDDLKIAEKSYLKACRRAQRSKKLNSSGKNFDCDALTYSVRKGDAPASELQWYTEWYNQALTEGDFDWEAYNAHSQEMKRHRLKSKSRRNPPRKKKRSSDLETVKKEYMKMCEKAERSRILNPDRRSQDCGSIPYLVDTDRMDINDLRWYTEWYRKALEEGEYDWEMYKNRGKKSKSKSRRRKSKSKSRRRKSKSRSRN